MNWIQKLFKPRNADKSAPVLNTSEWIKAEDKKPPHEVVLAACYTFDCGWTMDTVWWFEDKQCWMTTGSVESTEAHLPYTHWRKLPPYPNNK